MFADGSRVFLIVGIGRYWLWIEVVQIGVVYGVWREVQGRRNAVVRTQERIDLRKPIERIGASNVLRERQCACLSLTHQILKACKEIEAVI